uniref:MTCL family member 3a n=1 Tax=Cynoglossus semilaevis TaxID=244447 RepID=A0A3P8VFW5_CYNSE
MWSALMNGSGLHGGGGAVGGYVQSQGWEFVPCSRMERADRGRGKARNPLRRVSSPPTVFSQIYEPQFDASSDGGECEAGAQFKIVRGQMWPSPESQQQQTPHSRLKKKFDDLKKRHVQDKEEWTREKESLLREVADIQGGENRRILLDLKTVLEEVQTEVKREEEKRSELQLQYTRDRCGWELEKAELKCRIAQLEAKESTGIASRKVRSGHGPVTLHGAQEQYSETPTLLQEQEEQCRLRTDTHAAAMDLRYRLEHTERDWLREKAELLERFDMERREWETQLRDMQKKIEELYCEVRAKREGTRLDSDDVVRSLSVNSTSTGSSLLSDHSHTELISSSSQWEQNRPPQFPGFNLNRNIGGRESHKPTCFQAGNLCDFNIAGQLSQNEPPRAGPVDDLRSRGPWQTDSVDVSGEPAAIFHETPECGMKQRNGTSGSQHNVHIGPEEGPVGPDLRYGSDKKKNSTTLNAALKEIARVSEELCSYQDEIRRKSVDKRNPSESQYVAEGSERLFCQDQNQLQVDEPACDLSQIYDDFRALERENWMALSPENTWRANFSDMDAPAPPIPPRTSSWNLSTPAQTDTELHIPESPQTTLRKCHSPCVLVDRKCNSPSIVRKFEAMLQENEGKVLIDGAVTSCTVPANSNCNMGCCHNRWSCDASRFSTGNLSSCGTVQKSFSEVNIRCAGKDTRSDYGAGDGNYTNPDLQMEPPLVIESPVATLLSSTENTPVNPNLQGSRRNIVLEQKTAEFNRTLFHVDMGRGFKGADSSVVDASSLSCQAVTAASERETRFQTHCTDVSTGAAGVYPEMLADSILQISEVQPRETTCGLEAHELRINQENVFDLPFEEPQFDTMVSHSPVHQADARKQVQTTGSPSRKTQHKAATDLLFPDPVSSANNQPGQNVEASISDYDNPHGAKPQPAARAGASAHQSPVENKQRQMTQSGHQTQPRHASVPPSQSDSSRHGPRMMNDHPWKPLTLAAYPRPEGSRSNYGAVERILKNYESAARAQQSQSQKNEMNSSPNLSVGREQSATELDMLDMDPLPLPPTLRHTQNPHTAQLHSTHAKLSSHTAMGVKEIQLIVQGQEENRWNM